MEQMTSMCEMVGEIFSNPLFEEEINSMRIGQHHSNVESDLIGSLLNHDSSIIPSSSKIDSLLDDDYPVEEIDLTFTPDDPMPSSIEEDDDESRDILIREELLDNYSLPILENELFHFDIPLSSRPPIHGKNIPTLDVPRFHFYPLDQLMYGGN
nr:hypothetical protein [Tanacetum cinerariifolium]